MIGIDEELQESNALISNMLTASPIGVITYDETRQCTYANKSAAEITGATREQLLKQNYHTIESWKKSGLHDVAMKAVKTGKTKVKEVHLISTFGKEIWISCKYVPFLVKESGQLLLLIEDVSERRKAENALKESYTQTREKIREQTLELKKKNRGLLKEIRSRKEAGEKTRQINSVLTAIRKINQLITTSKDKNTILSQACRILVKARGLQHAWIALMNGSSVPEYITHSGMGKAWKPFRKSLAEGKLPYCMRHVLNTKTASIIADPLNFCEDCLLSQNYTDHGSIIVPLKHEEKMYGGLSINVSNKFLKNPEEIELLQEVANDLSFSLSKIAAEDELEKKNQEYYSLNEEYHAQNEELRTINEELNEEVIKRRKNEEALRESEHKFRETVKYLDEGFYSVTTDGLLIDHNKAFNRILGIDLDKDMKGAKLPDFWQNPDERKEYLNELMTKGFIRNYLINAKTISGKKIVVIANAHLVRDEKGGLLRIEGTFLDFTDRIQNEEALKRSENELRIRNRLAAIMGFSNLLVSKIHEDPEIGKYAKHIDSAGNDLLKIIEDTVEMAKLESNQVTLYMSEVLLGEFLSSVYKLYKEMLERERPELTILYENKQPGISVYTDPGKLKKVLDNLISNAMKFTESGYIGISSGLAEKNMLEIQVKDAGPGIPGDKQEIIFNKFVKVDSPDMLYRGSGLGLTISKKLVQLLGGDITVQSKPGKGSVFSVLLPVSQV